MNGKSSINVSNYVAIGDSITSGYMDGALCYYGQMHNYAFLLAKQLKEIGSNSFHQPLIPPQSIGLGFVGNSCLERKKIDTNGATTISYIAPVGDLSIVTQNIFDAKKPFQNLGIPGIKATHVPTPTYGNPQNGEGNFNPFFTRIASNPFTTSILNDAIIQNPSFFSLFLGNNDALAYALSGATENSITPLEGDVGVGFKSSMEFIIQNLTKNKAKGVIANLPGLDTTSYFRTIPYNALILTYSEASELQKKYEHGLFNLKVGKNAFIFQEMLNDSGHIRQLKKGEYILMDILLDPQKESYLTGKNPIPKKYVLTLDEIETIESQLAQYNQCIQELATQYNLAFVDTNQILKIRSADRVYNPTNFNFFYKMGGVFSLDGLHPNAYGHALLANEMIRQINITYNCAVPLLNTEEYKDFIPPILKNN